MATRDAYRHRIQGPTLRYKARGIRLTPALWEAIDDEADELGMTSGELLRRRLSKLFHLDDDVQNSNSSRGKEPHEEVVDLPL